MNTNYSSTTLRGRNKQGVINAPDASAGIIQIDFRITSTLTTALTIEMFNPESSQLIIANSDINTYQPLAGSKINASPTLMSSTEDGYMIGVLSGAVDFFVNAAGVVPAVGTTTKNICYFDVDGNAVWQPGYVNGVLPAGNVTLSCTTTGTSYRQFFNWSNRSIYDFYSMRMEYSETGQQENVLSFTEKLITGETKKKVYTPKTSRSEDQYDPLLITVPIQYRMRCNNGIRYNLSAFTTGASQVVTMNAFIKPLK